MPNNLLAIFRVLINPSKKGQERKMLDMPTFQSVRSRRAKGETLKEIA